MISKIQKFFETYFTSAESEGISQHQLNLAAAALLVEMTFQDDEVHEAEEAAVRKSLTTQLGLSREEADSLYQLAEEEKHRATDYHEFTSLIAEHYTQPQKVQLIEALWRVAYADRQLDKYEEHMVRRICDLIHVSHSDFIKAKHRVESELE